ncbi:MAG: hypothetical protein METHP_00562 [Methanoregula sp. SKADARSKE-2]|nr:MAG: hypothetical protein METHP_00562 [Methanoregula sp. SKADARSKE-2]
MSPRILDILDILVNPNTFFQRAMQEKENIKIPFLILLAAVVIGAIYGYEYGGLTATLMAGEMKGIGPIILAVSVIGAFLGIFIFWAVWAGVIFLMSMLFKGTGTFKRTLEFIGYRFLPQVLGSVISLIVALEYLPKVVIPHISLAALQDPDLMQEAIKLLTRDPALLEFTQISTLISIVFLLWSANIWIFGAQHARGLSMRDAVICVMVPVVASILFRVYNLTVMQI